MYKSLRATGRGGVLTGAVAAIVLAAGSSQAAQTYDMKIGFVTVNDSQHAGANWFVKRIARQTGGKITARVFPLAQLGKIPRQIEGLQLGTQEAFVSPPGFFVGINPAFQAADAPGLFQSFTHQHDTLNHPSVRSNFLNLAEQAGIIGNYVWSAGETAFATREPIRKLDDFKGRKIRVLASKMEVEFMKHLGVTGVPMPYSEVLPAIQRRVIDCARSAIVVMGPSKFYTAAKYITITRAAYIPSGMWLSKVWVNRLPKSLRAAVFEVGKDAGEVSQKAAVEITRQWETKWSQSGGEVIRLDKTEQAELMRRARPLGDKFLGGNPKTRAMYELVKAAAEETRN